MWPREEQVQFNHIYFQVRLGPGFLRYLKVPIPYSPPSVKAYTWTPSHYHPCLTVRAKITPSCRVNPSVLNYLHAEVSDGQDFSLPIDRR